MLRRESPFLEETALSSPEPAAQQLTSPFLQEALETLPDEPEEQSDWEVAAVFDGSAADDLIDDEQSYGPQLEAPAVFEEQIAENGWTDEPLDEAWTDRDSFAEEEYGGWGPLAEESEEEDVQGVADVTSEEELVWEEAAEAEDESGQPTGPIEEGLAWEEATEAEDEVETRPGPREDEIAFDLAYEGPRVDHFVAAPVENPGGGRIKDKRPPAPKDLVTVTGYRGRRIRLHRLAAHAWQALITAARTDGIAPPLLLPVSGYRSIERQQALWEQAVHKHGSPQAARRWVAPPGHSPHHSGRAIDLWLGYRVRSQNVDKMRDTAAHRWLTTHARRFGFYPYKTEPWHWEYNPPAVERQRSLEEDASNRSGAPLTHNVDSKQTAEPPAQTVRSNSDVHDESQRLAWGVAPAAHPRLPGPEAVAGQGNNLLAGALSRQGSQESNPARTLLPMDDPNRAHIATPHPRQAVLETAKASPCDERSPHDMTYQDIRDAVICELNRRFAADDDAGVHRRRVRLVQLFSGVPAVNARSLHAELVGGQSPLALLFRGRLATPTRAALLNRLWTVWCRGFFKAYEFGFNPLADKFSIDTNPDLTPAGKTQRKADVNRLIGDAATNPGVLWQRLLERAKAALLQQVPTSLPLPAALDTAAIGRLSDAQLELYRLWFSNGSAGIDLPRFQRCFEYFTNGQLRQPTPGHPGLYEPNGSAFFLFAEFAFLCYEVGVSAPTWAPILRTFVKTQEIFMHVYRENPKLRPPPVRAGLPDQQAPLRRTLATFANGNFKQLGTSPTRGAGQSDPKRKLALRAKYDSLSVEALKGSARDNLWRALRMR